MSNILLNEISNSVPLTNFVIHAGHLWIMSGTLRYFHLRMCRRWGNRVLNLVNLWIKDTAWYVLLHLHAHEYFLLWHQALSRMLYVVFNLPFGQIYFLFVVCTYVKCYLDTLLCLYEEYMLQSIRFRYSLYFDTIN